MFTFNKSFQEWLKSGQMKAGTESVAQCDCGCVSGDHAHQSSCPVAAVYMIWSGEANEAYAEIRSRFSVGGES